VRGNVLEKTQTGRRGDIRFSRNIFKKLKKENFWGSKKRLLDHGKWERKTTVRMRIKGGRRNQSMGDKGGTGLESATRRGLE